MIYQFYFWVFTQRKQNHYLKIYLYPHVIVALFLIVKTWKQPKCLLMDE